MKNEWLRFAGAATLVVFFMVSAGVPLASVALGLVLAAAVMLWRRRRVPSR